MIMVNGSQVQMEGSHATLLCDLYHVILAVKTEMMKEVDERVADLRIENSYREARGYHSHQKWLKAKEKYHIG